MLHHSQVFDLTSQDSFAHLSSWYDEFIIQAGEGREFVLVGNKSDLDDKRCVSQKAALGWAQKQANSDEEDKRIPYFETSAKDKTNVDQAFLAVAKGSLAKKLVSVCPLLSTSNPSTPPLPHDETNH